MESSDSEWLGEEFETYVANELFPLRSFEILNQTPRHGALDGRYIASCEDPDLRIRHKRSQHEFFVECKWRGNTPTRDRRMVVCKNRAQFERYRKFQAANRPHKVYIVVGWEGEVTRPSRIFCIPLDRIDDPWLYPDIMSSFERTTGRPFDYEGGRLI